MGARDELRRLNDELLAENQRLKDALFQCYVACGEDTDGAKSLSDMGRIDPPIEVLAVRAVEELRREYNDLLRDPIWDIR